MHAAVVIELVANEVEKGGRARTSIWLRFTACHHGDWVSKHRAATAVDALRLAALIHHVDFATLCVLRRTPLRNLSIGQGRTPTNAFNSVESTDFRSVAVATIDDSTGRT